MWIILGTALTSGHVLFIAGERSSLDAAAMAFTKRVVDGSRGGDVKIAADIDGDGHLDLVVGGSPSEALRWYRAPSWTAATIAVPLIEFTTDGEAGDVDGDGDVDLVVPDGTGNGSLRWFENPRVRPGGPGDPSDTSQWLRHTIGSLNDWGKDIELSDFDGNGRLDVAVRIAVSHMIFFQMGADTWNQQTLAVNHAGAEGMESGDVDGDGDMDLVVEGAWLRNPGGSAARTPPSWATFQIGSVPGEFKAVVTNLDGDQANEVLFSSSEGVADVVWFDPVNGNPTGSWFRRVIAPSIERAHTLQAGDMDGDGDTDVVVGQMHTSAARQIVVYENLDGQGGSWRPYLVDQGTGIHNGLVADIGNDGDLDIFGANWAGNAPVALWENLGGATSDTTPPTTPTNLSATANSSSQISLSWSASSDNVGVVSYRVVRNGSVAGTPMGSSFVDTGLAPSTTYTYRVSALDAAGNESPQSAAAAATTGAPADTTPPVISAVQAANVSATSATISWTTNEPATSRVDYGATTAYGTTALMDGGRTSHQLLLEALTPATTYHYRASGTDGAGNTGASGDLTFTTSGAPPPPSPSGLVAHWRFDEGAGAVASDAAGGYHGTLANGATWGGGQAGQGVGFDGADDYVAVPVIDVTGNELTMAAWVRSTNFPADLDQRFISKASGTAEQMHYWMLSQTFAGEPRLRFRLKAGNSTTTLIATAGALPLGEWYHAAATYDGAFMRVYLNGVEVGRVPKTGALATSSDVPVNLGRNPDASNHLHGMLDDVRIYGRALDAGEITALMAGTP